LNSGVQDADNLVWKLALSLKNEGLDVDDLLSTYDLERRPIGERIAKTSLFNMQAHALVLDKAIGLAPDRDEESNIRAMSQYFDQADVEAGAAKRQEVERALKTLDIEFYAHGAEVGWYYDLPYNGDYGFDEAVPNPQVKEDGEMELCVYHQTIRAGSQLPHVWVYENGQQGIAKSLRELVCLDKLVLFTTGSDWKVLSNPLVNFVVVSDGEVTGSNVSRERSIISDELSNTGAVLVRPDAIVAYRFVDDSMLRQQHKHEEFDEIVKKVLRMGE
jgi:hypothetical protein